MRFVYVSLQKKTFFTARLNIYVCVTQGELFTGIQNGLPFCLIHNANAVIARSSFTALY
jgi:hypothetical protein